MKNVLAFREGSKPDFSQIGGYIKPQAFLQWTSLSGKVCDPSRRDPHPFASTGQKSKRPGRASKVG